MGAKVSVPPYPVEIVTSKNGNTLGDAPNPLMIGDYRLEISRGNATGMGKIHKFGRNPDIDTGGFEAIWNGGGDYTGFNATVAETLEIFSSSAQDVGTLLSTGTATGGSATTMVDTGATFVSDGVAAGDVVINITQVDHAIVTAVTEIQIDFLQMQEATTWAVGDTYKVVTKGGTGAPIIELYQLLDGTLAQQPNEYVILNGITTVDTVGTYRRGTRLHTHGGTNDGNVTCRQKITTANIMAILPSGYGTTMIAAFTIPEGKDGYIDGWFAGLAGKTKANCNIRLMTRGVNDYFQVKEEFSIQAAGTSYVHRDYLNPKNSLAQRTDIKIMADTDTADTAVAAGFDLTLVDN
jgi:hypothetical protein